MALVNAKGAVFQKSMALVNAKGAVFQKRMALVITKEAVFQKSMALVNAKGVVFQKSMALAFAERVGNTMKDEFFLRSTLHMRMRKNQQMRIKIFWLFALILSLSLMSCNLVNDTTSSTLALPKRTPLPQTNIALDLNTYHSPNGKWDVYLPNRATAVVITSTATNSSFQDDFELGEYHHITSWFPDNSGFVLFDAEKGCQKCPWDKLIIYHINEESANSSHYEFEPLTERNKAFWHPIAWSQDGLKFAVIVGGDIGGEKIYVLDQQATVLNQLSPQLEEKEIIDPYRLVWKKLELYGSCTRT